MLLKTTTIWVVEGAVETNASLIERLRRIEALKEGHFLLSSGRHSAQYVEKFDLLRRPRETEAVCQDFAAAFRDQHVDVVVGPTMGGILLAFEVARQLGTEAAFAERRSDDGPGREIRRGTSFRPGARILVVDDILTTGGSVRETLAALDGADVQVIAVAVLVDRSGGALDFGVPLRSLATLDIETWTPEDCPLCRQRLPLVKPGTTSVP
jgi:orotate phosphoribosyltransferase